MKLIAGLGNPGESYRATRHNIGFRVVEVLGRRHGIELKEKRRIEGRMGRGRIGREPVVLLEPLTFMNLSGRSVREVMRSFGGGPDELIVIHDDVDLPLGTIRAKLGGGDGGHKGLRSIIQETGEAGFIRVRMGVGRPGPRGDVAGHVLAPFEEREKEIIEEAVARGADAVEHILGEGMTAAMNRYNPRRIGDGEARSRKSEGEAT